MQLLCYQLSTPDYQLSHKKTNRPCRSVPHSRRRHERRLNFSFRSAFNHYQNSPAARGDRFLSDGVTGGGEKSSVTQSPQDGRIR